MNIRRLEDLSTLLTLLVIIVALVILAMILQARADRYNLVRVYEKKIELDRQLARLSDQVQALTRGAFDSLSEMRAIDIFRTRYSMPGPGRADEPPVSRALSVRRYAP